MGVAREVDEPPDLRLVEHGEEGGRVLEAGGDRAPAREALHTVRSRLHERDERLLGAWVGHELAHRQHWRPAFDRGLLLHERDRADGRAG